MSTSSTSLMRVPSGGSSNNVNSHSSVSSTNNASSSLSSSTRSLANTASSLIHNPSSTLANATSPIAATATSVLPRLNLTPQKPPTTPPTQQRSQAIDRTPVGTPGKWEHPRIDEIIRRQNANAFDASNVRILLLNTALIAMSFSAPHLLEKYLLPQSWHVSSTPYLTPSLYFLRALFALNLVFALRPLFQPADACEDIPLTPAQRQLLHLPPMSRPATPQEQSQYATPPRYERASATPTSSAGSRTPRDSPSSQLLFSGGRDSQLRSGGERRRLSYTSAGRSSPLSLSDFDSAGSGSGVGSSPSKGGNKASVALNSKWLYEKGRGSPRSSLGAGGFL